MFDTYDDMKSNPMQKMILGTAQFGINYGINNKLGKPLEQDVFEILEFAQAHGVSCLDTAEDYGTAPRLIGDFHINHHNSDRFQVISKISHSYKDSSISAHLDKVLETLHVPSLEGYLFHNFNMYKSSPAIIDQLIMLKEKGVARKIGVSIYSNDQLLDLINDERCDIIQLPLNLLDNTSIKGEYLDMAKSAGKEVHIRSVYLQGLFFMDKDNIPAPLNKLIPYLFKIENLAREASVSLATLALQYIYNNPLVDKVLIGVDSVEHLASNINSLNVPMDSSIFEEVDKIKVDEAWLLNPVNWK